jgi:hypothetical protein
MRMILAKALWHDGWSREPVWQHMPVSQAGVFVEKMNVFGM